MPRHQRKAIFQSHLQLDANQVALNLPATAGGSDIGNQRLESLAGAKLTHDTNDVTLIGIHFAIEAAHFCFRDFFGQVSESGAQLRKSFKRRAPHDGDGVVGREIMAIIF